MSNEIFEIKSVSVFGCVRGRSENLFVSADEMTHFQGPGREGSKWQNIIPTFSNATTVIQINVKEIMQIDVNVIHSEENKSLQEMMMMQILKRHKDIVTKCKCQIKCSFVSSFVCFIAMIAYPFGVLFGLIIPSQHNMTLIIIYLTLLIVIEIIIVLSYYKLHDRGHQLEHHAMCLFIDKLSQCIWKHNNMLNIYVVFPKQIKNEKLIDHGKPLFIYICTAERDKSVTFKAELEGDVFDFINLNTTEKNHAINVHMKTSLL